MHCLINVLAGLGDHLIADIHIGGGGAVEESTKLFQNPQATFGTSMALVETLTSDPIQSTAKRMQRFIR